MSRVTEIRYVGFTTPDIEKERKFYTDVWGLKGVKEEEGLIYFVTNSDDELYVVRQPESRTSNIDMIALATDTPEDADPPFAKVKAHGLCQ